MATKVDTYDDLLNEQSNAGVAYLNSLPIELYMNTAGEQEARDVAERRTMTAEQRKAKMPQTGTKDTVFAEGSSASASENVQYQIPRDYTEGEPNDYTWAIHDGILNGVDMKRIDAAVAEFKKLRYYVHISEYGEMIVRVGYRADVRGSSDNKIVFVRGDFLRPIITRVVSINDDNIANMHAVREVIIDEAVSFGRIDIQVEIENEIAGHEYISVREIRNSESLKRENNPRAGTAGKRNSRTTRKGKRQYQVNRDTASDMDLLMGASMDGLSKAEADHLLRYRDRVNEIRQNQRKIDKLQAEKLTADINAQIKRLENANSIIYRKVNAAEQTDLMQRIIERERAAGDVEVQCIGCYRCRVHRSTHHTTWDRSAFC